MPDPSEFYAGDGTNGGKNDDRLPPSSPLSMREEGELSDVPVASFSSALQGPGVPPPNDNSEQHPPALLSEGGAFASVRAALPIHESLLFDGVAGRDTSTVSNSGDGDQVGLEGRQETPRAPARDAPRRTRPLPDVRNVRDDGVHEGASVATVDGTTEAGQTREIENVTPLRRSGLAIPVPFDNNHTPVERSTRKRAYEGSPNAEEQERMRNGPPRPTKTLDPNTLGPGARKLYEKAKMRAAAEGKMLSGANKSAKDSGLMTFTSTPTMALPPPPDTRPRRDVGAQLPATPRTGGDDHPRAPRAPHKAPLAAREPLTTVYHDPSRDPSGAPSETTRGAAEMDVDTPVPSETREHADEILDLPLDLLEAGDDLAGQFDTRSPVNTAQEEMRAWRRANPRAMPPPAGHPVPRLRPVAEGERPILLAENFGTRYEREQIARGLAMPTRELISDSDLRWERLRAYQNRTRMLAERQRREREGRNVERFTQQVQRSQLPSNSVDFDMDETKRSTTPSPAHFSRGRDPAGTPSWLPTATPARGQPPSLKDLQAASKDAYSTSSPGPFTIRGGGGRTEHGDLELDEETLTTQSVANPSTVIRPQDGFPRIHFNDPAAIVAGLDPIFLRDVARDPRGTVVFIQVPGQVEPFEHEQASEVSRRIRAVITAVTGDTDFSIVAPRLPRVRQQGAPLPITWTVRRLTPNAAEILVREQLFSTPDITFFTRPRTLATPQHLLTLGGFLESVGDQIDSMIRRTVETNGRAAFTAWMHDVLADDLTLPIDLAVDYIFETLSVDIPMLRDGQIIANLYVDNLGSSTTAWRALVAALRQLDFSDGYNDPALHVHHHCNICHSSDHPASGCRYPSLEGWRGPRYMPPRQQSAAGPSRVAGDRITNNVQQSRGRGGTGWGRGGQGGGGRGRQESDTTPSWDAQGPRGRGGGQSGGRGGKRGGWIGRGRGGGSAF